MNLLEPLIGSVIAGERAEISERSSSGRSVWKRRESHWFTIIIIHSNQFSHPDRLRKRPILATLTIANAARHPAPQAYLAIYVMLFHAALQPKQIVIPLTCRNNMLIYRQIKGARCSSAAAMASAGQAAHRVVASMVVFRGDLGTMKSRPVVMRCSMSRGIALTLRSGSAMTSAADLLIVPDEEADLTASTSVSLCSRVDVAFAD